MSGKMNWPRVLKEKIMRERGSEYAFGNDQPPKTGSYPDRREKEKIITIKKPTIQYRNTYGKCPICQCILKNTNLEYHKNKDCIGQRKDEHKINTIKKPKKPKSKLTKCPNCKETVGKGYLQRHLLTTCTKRWPDTKRKVQKLNSVEITLKDRNSKRSSNLTAASKKSLSKISPVRLPPVIPPPLKTKK